MKKIAWAALSLLLFAACQSEPHFTVNGNIYDASGKMLYLEATTLDKIVGVDSVQLGNDGVFHLKGKRPEYPEFYRLRVDDKFVNLSIDSTETIVIKAPYEGFASEYIVEGSENCQKIKELTLKQIGLQKRVDILMDDYRNQRISNFEDSLLVVLNNYKREVARQYILAEPGRPFAYFALFQKLNGYQIFDPLNDKEDIKSFAAVATNMNNNYPHSLRSKNLYNITIRGMKNTRVPEQKEVEIPSEKVSETGIIDITLSDLDGNLRRLTDLKGKVVLLDFSVYQSQFGAPHNMDLKELYAKYSAKGFEIYQVSFDGDEHFWKTSADHLPWICVRDANGVYSSLVGVYNIKQLPCFYLINRKNELCMSNLAMKDLDAAVKSLL